MSKRATKNSQRSREDGHAFYVYCVGEEDVLAPLFNKVLPEAIEEGAGFELVGAGGLAAVASTVPMSDYGEVILEERLNDPAWVATRAMRHELVVEHFAAAAAIVPLRFATIYLSRESVERMLAKRDVQLRTLVNLVRGREEWGLNIYVDRKRLRDEVVKVSPRLREMSEQADALSPGRAYMLRKQIDALRDTEAGEVRKRVKSEASLLCHHARLVGVGSKPLRANEKTEHGEVVARVVFLLDRRRRKALHTRAEKLAAEYAPLGFKMELVGPWPAYYFTKIFGETEEEGGEGEAPAG
jgi:hypothetical protein